MIKEAIRLAIAGNDLPFATAKSAMDTIMGGKATAAQIASFLTALRMKGETIEEITACATVMREQGQKLEHDFDVVEIVGTGGDEAFTFNISTVSAFVVAAAGIPVAKHGNRSVSSKCGAADVLEALGARLSLTPKQSKEVLAATGMCFMFAPVYHTSMKYAAPVRKEIGVRTIFNILGPLANPAAASIQLLGVYDRDLIAPLAQTLVNLGLKRAMVVRGCDGLDEITLTGPTEVCEIKDGTLDFYEINPADFGFSFCLVEDLTGGNATDNAAIAKEILRGAPGPKRDIVLLNAAACLYMAAATDTLANGVELARQTIDNGRAYQKMRDFVARSNEVAL